MKSANTAYLKEDYLKRKFLVTWEDLCSLLKISSTIEVSHEDNMDSGYAGTVYPEVNRRVQRLLRSDEFPDYIDICELINRSNTKHSLGISAAEKTEMARKVFKEVGKIIKSRRIKDYQHHFGSHLTDAVKDGEDPAMSDDSLLERLRASLEDGHGKMERLVEEFVVKEEVESEKGGGTSGSGQGDSCNSLEEEGEEEEEEEEGEEEEVVVESEPEDDEGIEDSPVRKKPRLDEDPADHLLASPSPSPTEPSPPSLSPSDNGICTSAVKEGGCGTGGRGSVVNGAEDGAVSSTGGGAAAASISIISLSDDSDTESDVVVISDD